MGGGGSFLGGGGCPKLLNYNVNSAAVKEVKVAMKQHCASRDPKRDDPLMTSG